MKRKTLLFTLALPVLLTQNVLAQTGVEKATSITTISRLVGIGDWVNSGAAFYVTDSTALSYSQGRGGDLTHTLKYDNEFYYVYNNADSQFVPSTQNNQEFDAYDNISDNTLQTYTSATVPPSWIPTTKYLYYYDISNKMTSQFMQNWNAGTGTWLSASKDVYTYVPGTSELYLDVYFTWNSITSTFDSATEKIYTYDVNGNLLQELDNTNSGSAWSPLQEYIYSYSTSNMMLSSGLATWNGSSYVNNYQYTYTYDTTGRLIATLYQTYNVDSAKWINGTLSLYSGFVGSNPMNQEVEIWNDTASGGIWQESKWWSYSYNSYGQMTSKNAASYNVSLGNYEYAAGDPLVNYHYDTVVVNGVKEISSNSSINVIPVPAQDILNITVASTVATKLDLSIVNLAGQLIRSWSVRATAQYATSIPTANLPAGNYLLNISGAYGNSVRQFTIVH